MDGSREGRQERKGPRRWRAGPRWRSTGPRWWSTRQAAAGEWASRRAEDRGQRTEDGGSSASVPACMGIYHGLPICYLRASGTHALPLLTTDSPILLPPLVDRRLVLTCLPFPYLPSSMLWRPHAPAPAVSQSLGSIFESMRSISFRLFVAVSLLPIFAACSQEAKKARLAERAERYFKAGEYEKAKIESMNVLRMEPRNAAALQRLGLIWVEQGAPLRAVPFLAEARKQAPNNNEVRMKFASVLATLGQRADARKEALKVLEIAPANGDALLVLADTTRTKEDVEETSQQLAKFPRRDSASFLVASARMALGKGDPGTAETLLQQAIAADPKSSVAYLAMGDLYVAKKDLAKAAEAYKTGADLSPPRSSTRVLYAQFKLQTGATEEAKNALTEITRQAPDYVLAWRLLGQIALAEKKYDEALADLAHVFSVDNENPDAHLIQAQAWLAKGEFKKGAEELERLDQNFRNVPAIKLQLARAYVQNNNSVQAMATLQEALAVDPGQVDAILLLAELQLRNGQPEPVITAMRGLLEKRPDLALAQGLLAEAYRAAGRLDEAAAIIQKRIEASPKNGESYVALGLILRQQGKTAEARHAFEQAAQAVPGSFAPVSQLIEMDIEAKDFVAAEQKVQEQINKNPKLAGAHFLDGKIHAVQRQWNEAEAALQKTLDLDANFSGAYDLLISIYLTTDRLPQALERLNAILVKEPENMAALMLTASIHEKRGDFAKAREAYERILALRPDSPGAQNNLAYLYAERLNEPDKAYEHARKARVSQPENPAIADTLGWVLYKRGEYQQAAALLRESIAKLADNAEAQFHFGMASYMMGETDAARTALRAAANSPIELAGKEEAQRRLTLLGDASGKPTDFSTEQLQGIVKEHPDDVIARLSLAASFEKQGTFDKAAAEYEEARKINPQLPSATMKLAQLSAGPLKNKEKAVALAKKARELAPNDPQISGAVGRIAYQTGDLQWAYGLLQEAARETGAGVGVLHDLAWAAYGLGHVGEAQETMQRVLKAAPDSAEAKDAKAFLALAGVEKKDLQLAAPEAEKVLQTDPSYVPALMVRGAVQAERNDSKAAAGTLEEVLRRFPEFTPAQKELAAIYAEDPGQIARAYELAVKARKALPDDPELARTLAAISYKRKEYNYALQLFEEAARTAPLDARSLFYLGMTHLQLKHNDESRKSLNEALAMGLSDPFASEAKRAISGLPKK